MSADPANTVTAGKVVSIHYTLTDDEGTILDSSEGRAPLDYLHGADNIVAGLEAGLAGHATGDSFRARMSPDADLLLTYRKYLGQGLGKLVP